MEKIANRTIAAVFCKDDVATLLAGSLVPRPTERDDDFVSSNIDVDPESGKPGA